MFAKTPTASSAARRPRRAGFSLLELMLVLGILGVLMAVASVSVLGGQKRANIRATEASLRTINTAITDYRVYANRFPENLDLLVGEYLQGQGSLNDAWGNRFYYMIQVGNEQQPYLLISDGPDGEPGTEDDIDLWEVLNRDPNASDGA